MLQFIPDIEGNTMLKECKGLWTRLVYTQKYTQITQIKYTKNETEYYKDHWVNQKDEGESFKNEVHTRYPEQNAVLMDVNLVIPQIWINKVFDIFLFYTH